MKRFIFVSILILMVFLMTISLFYLTIISGAIFSFTPNPPKPEITYGEFPISVTYEIDGEVKKIEDTVVCEFDGFEDHGSGGKWRTWKSYLKSGNERLILLKIDEVSELYFWYGSPDYYMGDLRFESKESYEQRREHNFQSDFIIFGKWINGEFNSNSISNNEALEKYGLKIVNVQYSQPIQNSFT